MNCSKYKNYYYKPELLIIKNIILILLLIKLLFRLKKKININKYIYITYINK